MNYTLTFLKVFKRKKLTMQVFSRFFSDYLQVFLKNHFKSTLSTFDNDNYLIYFFKSEDIYVAKRLS